MGKVITKKVVEKCMENDLLFVTCFFGVNIFICVHCNEHREECEHEAINIYCLQREAILAVRVMGKRTVVGFSLVT